MPVMAPGKKKNAKAKSKRALSVDFKKVKSKVGRKLAPAQNATKVEFKSKGIVISGQSVAQDKDGLAVNQRKQTLKELLAQVTHYNERMRKDALIGLKDLFAKHPKELVMHAVAVIEKLSPRITDSEKSVRQALILLLRSSVLPNLPEAMMKPLVPLIMAHVCSAMTHLVKDIRLAACTFLDLLLQHCTALVVPSYSDQITQHYVSLLGKGGISDEPGNKLANVLSGLEHFLSALKTKSITETPQSSTTTSVTHNWGSKGPVHVLHAYKRVLPVEVHSSPFAGPEGSLGQIALISTLLVPVLLDCWAEHAPIVCNVPSPDASSLECMVLIARCLCLIFQSITSEAAASSFAKDTVYNTGAVSGRDYTTDEWRTHKWMQQQFLPGLQRRLLTIFPICAPAVRLFPKVEEGLVALNVGICDIMMQFLLLGQDPVDSPLDVVLEYFESALYGMMLPPSHYSEGVSEPKLREPHVKSLVTCLPGLVKVAAPDWVPRLLQAFTHVFETCNSRSSTKMCCLSSMTQLVLAGCKIGEKSDGKIPTVASEFQRRWLQSLPKLLWELKDSHPNVTQAVLEMLLYIGRSSVAGSTLAESYNELQPAMVPFFCTFLPLKNTNDYQCVFGPFIKLPQPCQALATDLLYFYDSFSTMLLRALAHCALCPDLDVALAVRMVEVLQQAFCRGAIALGEHLSFLFTLLAGRTSSQASGTARAFPKETDAGNTGDDNEDFDSETMRRHTAMTGVICACLAQVGDGNVVLSILSPSISEELKKQGQKLRVLNGLFTAVAVLSRNSKQPDGLLLSDSVFDVLPKCIVNLLLRIKKDGVGGSGSAKQSVLDFIKRPCIILLARSREITLNVLKAIDELLSTVVFPETSSSRQRKEKVLFVQIVLELIQTERLNRRVFLDSGAIIEALIKKIEAQEDALTNEGRELRRLREELRSSTTSLVG